MSKLSDEIKKTLREIFPQGLIKEEYYLKFKGCKLFFDFYLPQYNILVEVQGRQHYEFVGHFHCDIDGFKNAKKRDNLKVRYAQENNMALVVVDYDEYVTKELLLKKMLEAQDGRYKYKE